MEVGQDNEGIERELQAFVEQYTTRHLLQSLAEGEAAMQAGDDTNPRAMLG